MEDTSLDTRYRRILAQVEASAHKVNRPVRDVTVVAVSKYTDASMVREAFALGFRDFGESRVQEARSKRSEVAELPCRWHFIGHLQTNKVADVVGTYHLVHSVDSWRLAQALSEEALQRGTVQPILVQVNTSGETSKYGVAPSEACALVEQVIRELPGVRVQGLMTMAPYGEDPEQARPFFRRLAALRDELRPIHPEVEQLSMGMSGDYPVAIEEGATMIRIGTALFGSPREIQPTPR